ncbi:MAG: DUF3524 domain-containing protein [Acidobacteriota bacterium]|nr:DUF3524 domain-containing protein [Acidobacteriota bacterium]
MKVLALEPFLGGSHRAFLEGWQSHSRHTWTTLGLPARKWKWRMRQSPLLFAGEIDERRSSGESWDVCFCSDMLALAELKGLLATPLGVPTVVYFHENQLTYPVRFPKERDYHFGLTNVTSALAADRVWFNSSFHQDDFLGAIPAFVRLMPHPRPAAVTERIRARAQVAHPGVQPPAERAPRGSVPHILWAARWEHDKGPDTFFEALDLLAARGHDFQVSVLGEAYRERPAVFDRARARLGDRVAHWGFVEPRDDYLKILAETDLFVSTARHEFFGLAAVEAMAAGATPLLPRRLSYPELVDLEHHPELERCFYDGSAPGLADRAAALMRDPDPPRAAMTRFLWSSRAPALDLALEELTRATSGVKNS